MRIIGKFFKQDAKFGVIKRPTLEVHAGALPK